MVSKVADKPLATWLIIVTIYDKDDDDGGGDEKGCNWTIGA